MTIQEIDWVRLAAFIDGEGCICITRSRKPTRADEMMVRLQVTNTNPRLTSWLQETFGGSVSVHRAGGTRKTRYDWHVGYRTATELLRGCRPFMLLKCE